MLIALAAAALVLGSPHYVPHGAGFGSAQPRALSNGGVPSGMVFGIRWTGWGAPVAHGRGTTPIYRPQGGYYGRRGRIVLRAQAVGACPDGTGPAYTELFVREAPWPGGPLGPWFKWSGSKTVCSFDDTDPVYGGPHPPGICGRAGSGLYTPGTVFDITAYRVSCRSARRVARSVRRLGCSRSGCVRRVRGLRCRLGPLHSGELAPSFEGRFPAQRVACRRGSGNVTAWLVRAQR
jgi:hypothetical protein